MTIKHRLPVENSSWTQIKSFPGRNYRMLFSFTITLQRVWPMLKEMEKPTFCAEKPPSFLLNPSRKYTFLTSFPANTSLELLLSHKMNAKVISLAINSCIRVIPSMRFYTGELTDGALSFWEPTKWALGAQNWGSTEWFVHRARHWEYVSLTINTTALAQPFLACFLKKVNCISAPFPQ